MSAEPLLRVRDLSVAYGEVQVLWDVSLEVSRGRDRGAGRRQWRGQEHAALDHQRPAAAAARARSSFDGQPIGGARTQRIVELGIAHVPEGPAAVSGDVGARSAAAGRASDATTAAQVRADLERVLELFPRLRERLNNWRAPLRRRAADGRDRPRR